MQRPVPLTGEVSQMFRDGLAARGIEELPQTGVTSIDPATNTAHLADGSTLDYDLFVGIPLHRAGAAGRLDDGRQATLRTEFPGVYAVGDVSTGPRTVPNAGIFAEAAATVVAQQIVAEVTEGQAPAPYEGWGIRYAEFGDGPVSKVEVNSPAGDAPHAERNEPSEAHAAEKAEFGRSRRARWFGLD